MSKALRIHSIETFGVHDGPGIRLVVFTQGCCFRCAYCHNPDTQEMETEQTKIKTIDQILELLEREKSYFGKDGRRGGITLSGGEPTLQAEVATELFKQAQERGFHTCLDTCGGIVSQQVKELYCVTDLVMLDVKHINSAWHQKLVGKSNKNTLENAKFREKSGQEMWLRYVLVPGWSDQKEHLHAWGQYFKHYQSVTRVELIAYHELGKHKYQELGRSYRLADVKPPSKEAVEAAAKIFRQYLGDKVVMV